MGNCLGEITKRGSCCLAKIEIQESLKTFAEDLEIIRDLKPYNTDEQLTKIIETLREIGVFMGRK